MQFEKVIMVQPEYSYAAFLRQVLITLGINKDTPVDVVDVEFGEVRESIREIVCCTAHIEGECTASVGYDRQEPYTEYEKYREKVGDTYVTRTRPVTKYRTVTDWRPFHTRYEGDAVSAVYNSDICDIDRERIMEALLAVEAPYMEIGGTATLNAAALEEALLICKAKVHVCEVTLPGDREKDKRYNDKATIENLVCYKMPYYEVTFTYKGKKYEASGFGTGRICVKTEYPPNDMDITAVVKAKTAPQKAAQSFWWTAFLVSFMMTAALCYLKFPWLCPLPVVTLIIAQTRSKAYKNAYINCSDTLSGDVMKQKVEALKTALQRQGFVPLSEEVCEDLDTCSVPGAAAPKDISIRLFFAWALTVILVIASAVVGRNAYQSELHSPENVDIEVVEKRVYYDPDASAYINGCYYIELDYEIESEKLGVEYIEMKVYVSDKKGKELGTIRSTLSDLKIDKGEKTIVETTLSENQPERNEFFAEIYEMDLEDLEFEFEIGRIQYSDGENYRNKDYNSFG